MKKLTRRSFMVASASFAALAALNPKVVMAKQTKDEFTPISLTECIALTPKDMATKSVPVQTSIKFLNEVVEEISNPSIKATCKKYLQNPAPTIMSRYVKESDRVKLHKTLSDQKLLPEKTTAELLLPPVKDFTKATQPYWTAPGSGYLSHHSYPGGLATHLAVNVGVSKALFDSYSKVYGYEMDKDVVIASQLLHDFHKPWVFQWSDDASSLTEQTIVDQGAHHVLSIAQGIHDNLSPDLVVAMACAHNPPMNDTLEQQIISWIKAAAIIAGADPVNYGLLSKSGATLPVPRAQEGFITHLGDHDYVLTVPAAKWMITELQRIGKEQYGMTDADLAGKKFNSFRNYLFSQASVKRLHNELVVNGEKGLNSLVSMIVVNG